MEAKLKAYKSLCKKLEKKEGEEDINELTIR